MVLDPAFANSLFVMNDFVVQSKVSDSVEGPRSCHCEMTRLSRPTKGGQLHSIGGRLLKRVTISPSSDFCLTSIKRALIASILAMLKFYISYSWGES